MVEITDISDNRIRHYRSLRYTPQQHINENIFITEGKRVVEKLLTSSLQVISFFATEEFYQQYAELLLNKNIPPENQFIATKALMTQIVGFKLHTGIMAIARQPKIYELSELSDTIIAVDNVIDSENIGAIIRNIAAFNFDSFLLDSTSSSPYLRRAVRVSMGTIFSIKVTQQFNLYDALIHLKKIGYTIIAAEINSNSIPLYAYKFPQKKVIIFGNEANGVSSKILQSCDTVLHIPINKDVPSINVAATSALFLNHIANY